MIPISITYHKGLVIVNYTFNCFGLVSSYKTVKHWTSNSNVAGLNPGKVFASHKSTIFGNKSTVMFNGSVSKGT